MTVSEGEQPPVLEGRRALVTGAGRGIGRAISTKLATAGARVVLAARSHDQLEAVTGEIEAAGGEAHPVRCDITDEGAVAELVDESEHVLGGPVDTLVNNAGVYEATPFQDQQIDAWQRIFDVNVMATVRVTRAFLPGMVDLPRARVINIASIAGLKGTIGQAAYNSSKHAVIGLTRCLALEYGRTSVRVNAICPGFTMTDMIDLEGVARVTGREPDEVWEGIEQLSSIGRTVTLDEIAALALYLASPAADGMNGQSIAIDGGVVY